MSRGAKILLGVLVALILIGICVIAAVLILRPSSEPEPEATATEVAATLPPPTVPEEGGDASWERVQAAGKIIVGTAADYPPFEYYVEPALIDGFDIALMDEIGRRLGIQAEYHDFAFDGLGPALQLGQIDAAIAAISVTSERESVVDFTNVYLVGEDGILASAAADISLNSVEDLVGYRIGVQRNSVYENWVQKTLVDTGKTPASNLFVYEKAEDAVRDLREGRLELVILDLQPAEVAASAGGVKVVAQGLNQQRYAVALAKGAQELKTEIDRVLTDLSNEGFVTLLAKQYLDMAELLPTPAPGPTSTPAPPPACVEGLAFVEHVQPPPGAEMQPGQSFTKIWRVQNTGTCTWDGSYQVVYVSGNTSAARMGGQPTPVQGQVPPGQTYDVTVELVAPLKPGSYQAIWQMQNGQGQAFGVRLKVDSEVLAVATVTPAPTQTPVPGITFTVDRSQIKAGECVEFYWKVDNVKEVYFYAEGKRWQDSGVTGAETRRECPPVTTTYYLRVVKPDNSVEVRQISIYVEPAAELPIIRRFTVDPPNQITLGQCVDIRWNIEGSINVVTLAANDTILWNGAPIKGSYQHCPQNPGTVAYAIEATNPGGTSRQQQYVNVVDAATATPVPTAAPELPVIQSFSVTPAQIPAGECAGISWSMGGGTSYSRILRNGRIVLDDAEFSGQQMDCLDTAGSYTYRLEAYNPTGESVFQEQVVTVSESAPQNPLAGTRWQVTAYRDGSQMTPMLEGTTLTAVFGADGNLNGSAGCNTYSTRYLADDKLLAVFPPSMTSQLCVEPEGIMEQEAAFLAAFQSASSFGIEGGQLFISSASADPVLEMIPLD
jgi:polar amino acid transport system substrate-binding protein